MEQFPYSKTFDCIINKTNSNPQGWSKSTERSAKANVYNSQTLSYKNTADCFSKNIKQ
jgi:hypothetical protein